MKALCTHKVSLILVLIQVAVVLHVDETWTLISLPIFNPFFPFWKFLTRSTFSRQDCRYGSPLGTVGRNQSEKSTVKSIFKALFTSRTLLSLIMTLSNTVIYFMIWSTLPGASWIIYSLRLKRYFYSWALYWEDENSIPFFKEFKKFWTNSN